MVVDEGERQPLPILARLDRLEHIVQCLEERRRSLSASPLFQGSMVSKIEAEDRCMTLSAALQEVDSKGSIMERLKILESRVLDQEDGYTEGCSSNLSKSNRRYYYKRPSSNRKLLGWFPMKCGSDSQFVE